MESCNRKISGLTQKELADIAAVGKTVIFDMEHGKETVRLDTVLKVLNALNIKVEFKKSPPPFLKDYCPREKILRSC